MSDSAFTCDECGKPLPDGTAEGGLCPNCLLGLGLKSQSLDDDTSDTALAESLFQSGPQGVQFHYFGDYELLEEVARGGMGVVYKAHQISLKRTVAIKLILAEKQASDEVRRRFKTEAEAAAGLSHPNIVPIYETGQHEGHPYLSMKLIEGPNLAELLRDGGQVDGPRLIATVARAVHHAHQHGVLHRDLKPSNILIEKESGEPFVSDFGLAKLADRRDEDVTRSVAMLGTPRYMSPEQCQGGSGKVTTASDVYALGVILYETLAGRPPFDGESTLEVIRKITQAEAPRFSERSVPRDLETICRKCLEKDPAKRYVSALALAEDLERFDRGEPVQARPVLAPVRAWRWCLRNKALAGLGAAAALAATLGSFGIIKARREAEEARVSYARNYALRMTQAWFDYHDGGSLSRAREALDATRPLPGQEDRRGWEWRMLWGLVHSGKERVVGELLGRSEGDVQFSGDGQRLFAVSHVAQDEDRVEMWNVSNATREDMYEAGGSIRVLCAARDLALVIKERAFEVHRFTDGEILTSTPISPFSWIRKAHFSRDGRYVVVPMVDRQEVLSEKEIAALTAEGFQQELTDREMRIIILEVDTGAIVYDQIIRCPRRGSDASGVRLSSDGGLLVRALPWNGVEVIDWRSKRVVFSDKKARLFANADVLAADFSPTGETLALAAGWGPQPVWLIDLATGDCRQLISQLDGARRARAARIRSGSLEVPPGARGTGGISFSDDGDLVACFGGSQAEIWETETGDWVGEAPFASGASRGVFSPDNEWITAIAGGSRDLVVHPVCVEDPVKRLTGPMRCALLGIGNFLPGSPQIVVTLIDDETLETHRDTDFEGIGGVPVLIDAATLTVTRCLDELGNLVLRAILLPGDRVLSADVTGAVKVLDLASGEITDVNTRPEKVFPGVVIHKLNAVMLLYPIEGRPWELRDLDTFEVVLEGEGAWSVPINFTDDEEWVVCPWPDADRFPLRKVEMNPRLMTGDAKDDHYPVDIVRTDDGRLIGLWKDKLWDANTGEVIVDGGNVAMSTYEAMFLPGGKRILSMGRTLWDMEIGTPVMRRGLEWRGSLIELPDISPDGNVIMVQSADGPRRHYLHLWRAPSWEEIEEAEGRQ